MYSFSQFFQDSYNHNKIV